ITGGTGFVGPHVVRAIANAGHDLKLLVRDSTRSRELPGQPVVGEMTNTVSLQHAVEGVDAVVHLVAIRQGREEQFKRVMEQGIQPIWADDVAAYFVAALDKPETTNRTFELGGPDIASWNEFWQRLRAALGIRRRPIAHIPIKLMRINALVTERLPGDIPLTRDLLTMLEHGDNVVSNDDAVQTFQLPLVPLDEQLRRAA